MVPYIKLYLVWLLAAILFCGCSAVSDTLETEPVTSETCVEAEIKPDPTMSTEAITEIPAEPVDSLDVECGSHQLRYMNEISGEYMDYCLFVPENAVKDMPLIIFLHGDGEVGKPEKLLTYGIWSRVFELYGNDYPFIGLSPCTHVATWTSETVTETTKNLIDYVVATCHIDPDRIILTGHSLGAIGMWHMVNRYGDFFAGAVPISCGTNDPLDYAQMAKVPILGVVGNVGTLENNYNRAMDKIIRAIRDAGGIAELNVIDGMSHEDSSTMPYTEEVFAWMLSCNKEENYEKIQ